MEKTMAIAEHRKRVGKLYYQHKVKLAEVKDQCLQEVRQEELPKTNWVRSFNEMVLAVEKWLHNHKKTS